MTPSNPKGTGEPSVTIDLYDADGLIIVSVSGPAEIAMREIAHYAAMYADEGPLVIKTRRRLATQEQPHD